jgi:hypothetical protein|tara:strand:- start:48 stop:344 length:297 start_codon:yes stop_codon:yes gene_type:complete
MAITKEIIEDKIEVVGDYKNIGIRKATVIKEDGVEISRTFSRVVLECVLSTYNADSSSWSHADTDVSGESSEVQGIANVVWTTTIKNARKAHNESVSS